MEIPEGVNEIIYDDLDAKCTLSCMGSIRMTMRAMVILQGLQVCRMYTRKHKFFSNSKQMDLEKKSSLST